MTQDKTLNTYEVCHFLGVPFQTLNQWITKGALEFEDPNPGRGRSRRFTREDVAVSVVVKEVLRAGGTFGRAKNLARAFRGHLKEEHISDTLLVPRGNEDAHFVTAFGDVQETIKDLKEHSVLFIPLDLILREVNELFAGKVEITA